MRMLARRERRSRATRWSRAMEGAVTVVAFTEAGRMHRVRISRRLLVGAGLLVVVLLIGSTTSVLRLFHGDVDLARMTYLEQENQIAHVAPGGPSRATQPVEARGRQAEGLRAEPADRVRNG